MIAEVVERVRCKNIDRIRMDPRGPFLEKKRWLWRIKREGLHCNRVASEVYGLRRLVSQGRGSRERMSRQLSESQRSARLGTRRGEYSIRRLNQDEYDRGGVLAAEIRRGEEKIYVPLR